jgi:hypothetical protein
MKTLFVFIETNISVISLFAGIIAALIAFGQLYLQRREMKLGNRINSLESLASMLRNFISDKQELLMMNKRKISEFEALENRSEEENEKLQFHKEKKEERNTEIISLYNGLLSVNMERCKLMDDIENKLDENVSKAINDTQEMFVRRKTEEEKRLEAKKLKELDLLAELEGL